MSYSQQKILVFTATFNEKENLESLVIGIRKHVKNSHILVVDDNSPDGTGDLLARLASEENNLTVIQRPGKLGLGSAHYLAMIYAIKNNYDLLVTMDADLSHDPSDIPRLIEGLDEKTDFVIGSRYATGGSCDYQGYRKNLSVIGNKAARMLLNIPIHEFTTSFRVFRVSKLSQVNFNWIGNYGYSFFLEAVFRLNESGLIIKEVPIHFYNRNSGISKIPKLEIFRGMRKLAQLTFLRFLKSRKELPSQIIDDLCTNCGGNFLYEISTESNDASLNTNDSNVYKCSSMSHGVKPQIARCLQCDLEQIPLSKRPKNLSDLYGDVVDQQYLDHLDVKHKTFDEVLKKLNPYLAAPGTILEIGSYCGLFLTKMSQRRWKCTGIEPSKWASEQSRRNADLNIYNCGVEEARSVLNGEKFDVIVSWDVIEHVSDPGFMIKVVSDHLKHGGVFAFSTLDIGSWFPRVMGKKWPWLMEMHLFYFTPKVLKNMLLKHNLELLEYGNYCHYASLRYIYKKFCFGMPKAIRPALLIGQRVIPNWVIAVNLGDVKFFIARKIVA